MHDPPPEPQRTIEDQKADRPWYRAYTIVFLITIALCAERIYHCAVSPPLELHERQNKGCDRYV